MLLPLSVINADYQHKKWEDVSGNGWDHLLPISLFITTYRCSFQTRGGVLCFFTDSQGRAEGGGLRGPSSHRVGMVPASHRCRGGGSAPRPAPRHPSTALLHTSSFREKPRFLFPHRAACAKPVCEHAPVVQHKGKQKFFIEVICSSRNTYFLSLLKLFFHPFFSFPQT